MIGVVLSHRFEVPNHAPYHALDIAAAPVRQHRAGRAAMAQPAGNSAPARPDDKRIRGSDGVRIWYAVFGLGQPVVLLHGGLAKRSNTLFMADQIPGSGLLIEPQVSHVAFLQDAEQFNADVQHFLRQVR
jgi:pimeloyl-ACP methyl ester carboxylesterase